MSSYIFKFVTKKFGTEDPYFDEVEVDKLDGAPKTVQKIKKKAPVGISLNDVKVYEKVKRRAYRLDLLFNFFGYRMGIANIVGIIPILGPIFNIFFSVLIYKTALKVEGGLPLGVQAQMIFNIFIDFALGLIPIIGDIIFMLYKANSRNVLVLEKHLTQVGEVNLGKRARVDGLTADEVKEYIPEGLRKRGSEVLKKAQKKGY